MFCQDFVQKPGMVSISRSKNLRFEHVSFTDRIREADEFMKKVYKRWM